MGAAGYVEGTERKVFTLELNQPASGQYRFTLLDDLDHHAVVSADDLENIIGINFNNVVRVTDTGDSGDSALIANFTLNVIDDVPVAVGNTNTLLVPIGDLDVQNIVAQWTNIQPGGVVSTFDRDADGATDELRWGNTGNTSTDSGYGFVDAPAANLDDLATNDTFSLGTFTHFNNPVSGTPLSSTTLSVHFTAIVNGVTVNNVGPVLVNFTHTETPNDGDNNPNDGTNSRDIISISTTTTTVNIAGQNYSLDVLGFVDGLGNIVSTVRTNEGESNAFQLAVRFESAGLTVNGNVLTNDSAGADGAAAVVGVAFNATNDTDPAGGGFQVDGAYGTLVLQANGGYVYTLTSDGANVPDGATETFVYTMQDGDGDQTTANLVITLDVVDNIPPTVAVNIVDTSLNDGDTSSVVNFTFSEAVTNFTDTDVTVVGGTLDRLPVRAPVIRRPSPRPTALPVPAR